MESILKMMAEGIFLDIHKHVFSSITFSFLTVLIFYIFEKKEKN